MKMQKLFENWNKFKSGILIEDVISEVSDQYSDHVEEWMADNGGEMNLPFGDIFDGQTRTVIPLGTAIQPGSEMAKILMWLEQQGYKTDFKTGLVSKEFKSFTGKPGAPGTKEVMRVKQQKIGKVLQRAADLLKKIESAGAAQNARGVEWYAENPGIGADSPRGAGFIVARDSDPEYKRLQDTVKKNREEYAKHFRSDTYLGRVEAFVEYWNNNSRYYRENPEEMMTDYSVIITRHPVDVLRMSDHGNIESCHSEGSDYFHCAIKEAKGAGAVAYIVETGDLDQVDVEDNEIFVDSERGIDGIEPLGRIRLRRFDKTGNFASDNKYSLLLPEKREYGTTIPGFYDAVKDWAVKTQEPKWSQDLKEDGTLDPNILRDFVRKGGEYQDTPPRSIFMHTFADYGGKGFEHAEGGRWDDDQSEEEQMGRGLEGLIEEIEDRVYEMQRNAERHGEDVDDGGIYVRGFSYEVIDPDTGSEWDRESSYAWAEQQGEGSGPAIQASAECVIRAMLNGPNAEDFPSNWRELQPLANDVRSQIDFYADHGSYSHELSDYELEEDSMEDYVEFVVRFDFHGEGDDFEHFCDALAEDQKSLGEYRDEMISVLQEHGFTKPSFSDILRKDIEEERQNFSKFVLQPDNTGGYTLMYPMHGDALLPDSLAEEDQVVMNIPAGRMPTREIMHATFGDVVQTGGWRMPSYRSPKFTRQVLGNMAKLFAQAHMAAKRQQELPLQEQLEEGRGVTVEDIQDYIAQGFTLSLSDVSYEKGSGTKQTRSDFTPETGVPRHTVLAVVRFVLDDEPHDDLTLGQTEELFKAALNFVKMLDEDISLLGDEVTGVLQSLTHKEESSFASKGIEIKELLSKYAEIGTKIDDELDALVMKWKDDADKGNLPGIQNLLTPDQVARGPAGIGASEPRRHYYRGQVGTAFEGTIMEQYVDNRLDLLDEVGRQARLLRTYENPGDWSKFTDEVKAKHIETIDKVTNSYNRLQTVEELSKLFESAPNLMKLIQIQVAKVLQG